MLDLTAKAMELYGSRHYLFMLLSYNGLILPLALSPGQAVEFPPRASTARLGEALERRRRAHISPI